MSKKMLALAMGFAALATAAENPNFLNMHNSAPMAQPDYLRKKCKSCKSFHAGWGSCGYPNHQACKNYIKRKK